MVLTLLLLSLFIYIMVLQVTSYNLRCPATSEWSLTGKAMCNITDKYFCLYNNVENHYVQGCKGPDLDRKGSKRIVAGDFTRALCKEDRYQPFTFWTNGSSDCVYQKSLCSEEGQVIYSNGSSKGDRFCSCDFTSGYAFVETPRNLCYCDLSALEDCSCYLKTCTEGYTLSADYECVGNTSKPTICPGSITKNPKDEPDRPILPNSSYGNRTEEVLDLDLYRRNELYALYGIAIVLFLIIVFTALTVRFRQLINRYVSLCNNQIVQPLLKHVKYYPMEELNDTARRSTKSQSSDGSSDGSSSEKSDTSEQEYNDTDDGPQRTQSDVKSSDVSNSSKPDTSSDHPMVLSHNRTIDNDYPKEKWDDTARRSTKPQSSDGSSDGSSLKKSDNSKQSDHVSESVLPSVESSNTICLEQPDNSDEKFDEADHRSTSSQSADGSSDESSSEKLGLEEDDEVYYLRIVHLLFTLAAPVLRIEFNKEVHPDTLCNLLSVNRKQITNQKPSKYEMDTLFPYRNKNSVTSATFDITIMTTLLKILAKLEVEMASTGNKANVLKIFDHRDRLGINGQLSFDTFNKTWDDISQAILRLSSSELRSIEQKGKEKDSESSRILARIRALSPVDFQNKRLHTFLQLTDVYSSKIYYCIIMEYCALENMSVEHLLKKEKHTLFHKRKKTRSCCRCEQMATFQHCLAEKDWNTIYRQGNRKNLHICKCKGHVSKCPERFYLKHGFNLESCDRSLFICIILYIPAILKFTLKKICSSEGFENFMDKHKHRLYHATAMISTCCMCIKDPGCEKILLNKDWETFYEKCEEASSYCSNRKCHCKYRAHKGINNKIVDHVEDNLLSKILSTVGPISSLKSEEDNVFKSFISGDLNKQQLRKSCKDTKTVLYKLLDTMSGFELRKDMKKKMSSIKKLLVEDSKVEEDLQAWASKRLEDGETSESSRIQRPIIIRGKDGLKLYEVPSSGDFKVSGRKPNNVTQDEIYFLRIFNMLLKVAYPAVRVRFDKEFPPEQLRDKLRDWYSGNGDEQRNHTQHNNNGKTSGKLPHRLYLTEKQKKVVFYGQSSDLAVLSETNSPPDSEEHLSKQFDIQLMGYLIRERMKIKDKPDSTDSSISKDLQKLLDVDDKIMYSCNGQLTQITFNNYWEDIKEASVRLGGEDFKKLCFELEKKDNILGL